MQREVKIGMPVVYQLGETEPPLTHRDGVSLRQHAALVCGVCQEGEVDLIIFPFSYYSFHYRGAVPKGNRESTMPCWYFPEEG